MYNPYDYDYLEYGEEDGEIYEDEAYDAPQPATLVYNIEAYQGYMEFDDYDTYHTMPPGVFEFTFPGPALITLITIFVGLLLAIFLVTFAGGSAVPAASAIAQPDAPVSEASVTGNPLAAEDSAETFQPSTEAAAAPCEVSDLFPGKVTRWCSLISYYANRQALNPDLVAALIWLESGGNEVAYSKSGAVGLMQIMPQDGLSATFMCVNGPCFSDRPTIAELENPEFNIKYGTRMLARLQSKHGDLREALKSYGPMNVGYYYADKVLGLFNQYGKTP